MRSDEDACKNVGYTWKSEHGCYKVYSYVKNAMEDNKNWTEARDICATDGADLITIDSIDDARVSWTSKNHFKVVVDITSKNLLKIFTGRNKGDVQMNWNVDYLWYFGDQ